MTNFSFPKEKGVAGRPEGTGKSQSPFSSKPPVIKQVEEKYLDVGVGLPPHLAPRSSTLQGRTNRAISKGWGRQITPHTREGWG